MSSPLAELVVWAAARAAIAGAASRYEESLMMKRLQSCCAEDSNKMLPLLR